MNGVTMTKDVNEGEREREAANVMYIMSLLEYFLPKEILLSIII